MAICHIFCTRRCNLWLPEVGQNIWPKHVGTLCDQYKHCQLSLCSHYIYIYIYIACQTSMTICHIFCTRRCNLWLPEVGQKLWPKHVGTLCDQYKHCATKWS